MFRATYVVFNARDIDAALALMTADVAWPGAFKGGFVRGPEETFFSEPGGELYHFSNLTQRIFEWSVPDA